MNYFSRNIKLLRKRRKRTQDEVAIALDMKRSTLSGYENEVGQPTVKALLAFSKYFGIAIDTLLKVDLGSLQENQLRQLERGYDVFINGKHLRVLATTVNNENNENVELVPEKAQAGYTGGYADPDYIKVLPAFNLPFLSREKKYRTFQISGDSMLPIPNGSYVTGEYVQNWQHIKNGKPYVFLTLNDGIVFKIAENKIEEKGVLKLHSLNPLYEAYEVKVSEVREVWKFIHYISGEFPEANQPKNEVLQAVEELKKDVKAIQTKLELGNE